MGYGSVINVFGSVADLDQIPDGSNYRKVVAVNEYGQITAASIAEGVISSGGGNLDEIADGYTYRRVVSVNEFGQITQSSIAEGVSLPAMLADGSVLSNHIAAGAVLASHIASGQIDGTHLSAGCIYSNHIASGQVTSDLTVGWTGTVNIEGTSYQITNGLVTGLAL